MPNCFSLTQKGATESVKLTDVDDAICAWFGVKPDVKLFYEGWVDSIGLMISIGKALGSQELKDAFHDYPEALDIIAFLEERYTSDAWYQSH